jgi:hypothetical protein
VPAASNDHEFAHVDRLPLRRPSHHHTRASPHAHPHRQALVVAWLATATGASSPACHAHERLPVPLGPIVNAHGADLTWDGGNVSTPSLQPAVSVGQQGDSPGRHSAPFRQQAASTRPNGTDRHHNRRRLRHTPRALGKTPRTSRNTPLRVKRSARRQLNTSRRSDQPDKSPRYNRRYRSAFA